MSDVAWPELYRAALSESDPIKLTGRIEAARHAIRDRLDRRDESVTARERLQLQAALNTLLTLAARRRSA